MKYMVVNKEGNVVFQSNSWNDCLDHWSVGNCIVETERFDKEQFLANLAGQIKRSEVV